MTQETKDVAVKENNQFALFSDNNVNIQELIQDNLGDEDFSPQDLDRVTLPAGGGTTFELPTFDGVTDVKTIDCIIVSVMPGRAYWKEALKGEGTPPDCTSNDAITGFGDPGGPCAECPFNQFGSADSGAGKACKERRNLFFLTDEAILPYVLQVPATSIKLYKKYVISLTRFGNSVYSVRTQISLEKTKNSGGIAYSQLVFRPGSELSPEQTHMVRKYKDTFKAAIERAHKETVASS